MDKAERAFARALVDAPGHTAALHGLCSVLMGRGEFDRAAERCRQVIARDPADVRAPLLLASCLFELGKSEEAIAQLRTALRASPQSFGRALKTCVESGHGRLWLTPSVAAKYLGIGKDG